MKRIIGTRIAVLEETPVFNHTNKVKVGSMVANPTVTKDGLVIVIPLFADMAEDLFTQLLMGTKTLKISSAGGE